MTVTGYRARLISAMVTFLVIDAAAMVGRIYVRTKMITRSFWLDDLVLILTYVSLRLDSPLLIPVMCGC